MTSFDESAGLYRKMGEFLGSQPRVGEGSPVGLREFQNRLRQQELRKKISMAAAGEGELHVQGILDLLIAQVLADGFSAEKEQDSIASAKSYARWSALKWAEGFLASGQVPKGTKRQALYRSWAAYLAAEDNSGFWKDLRPGLREASLKRLELLRLRSSEKAAGEE